MDRDDETTRQRDDVTDKMTPRETKVFKGVDAVDADRQTRRC
jgi:hypothetical protein